MSILTVDRLREVLSYNPTTGVFVWLVSTAHRITVGDIAGCLDGYGYLAIRVDGRLYKAHRLAWLYVTGEWPSGQIDHCNCVPADNRITNLREASQSQNCANTHRRRHNKSGFKGVGWDREGQKWTARIRYKSRTFWLGRHETPEAAHAAYVEAAMRIHGEFARLE